MKNLSYGLEVEGTVLSDRFELRQRNEEIEGIKNESHVSGKRNWMDVTEIGNSRREDLKKGRIKSAISDTISLICLWHFPENI